MAFSLASNRQTQQPSSPTVSVKCILATRVFYNTAGTASMPEAPVGNQDLGTSPHGNWTDFGAVMRSKVMLEYNKEYADVRSGLDGVYVGSYVTSKTAQASFALDNFDAAALQVLTQQADTTKKVASSISGENISYYTLHVGREDAVTMSLLLVGVNKIDRKEHHYFIKDADCRFAWEEDNDAIVIRVTAVVRPYQYETGKSDFYKMNIWDAPSSLTYAMA